MSGPVGLDGKAFGRLTVLARSGSDKHGKATWKCLCECGEVRVIEGGKLRTGHTQSCGCFHRERLIASTTRHGHSSRQSRSVEYTAWANMLARCYNKNSSHYKDYGGRGISVCDRWRNSFILFLEDIGRKPHRSLSIDRKNNDGDYEPGNCRWTTQSEQTRNRREPEHVRDTATGRFSRRSL